LGCGNFEDFGLLSESGCSGFKDLQDRREIKFDFWDVGILRILNFVNFVN
jgi:hypothetical protein